MGFVTKDPYQPLVPIKGTKFWKTTKYLSYFSNTYNKLIIVKPNFITDGASIPPLFWPIIGHPLEKYHLAAIIHDALYDGTVSLYEFPESERRYVVDNILYEACIDLHVNKFKSNLIYYGVRIGGWYSWNNYRKRQTNKQKILV